MRSPDKTSSRPQRCAARCWAVANAAPPQGIETIGRCLPVGAHDHVPAADLREALAPEANKRIEICALAARTIISFLIGWQRTQQNRLVALQSQLAQECAPAPWNVI